MRITSLTLKAVEYLPITFTAFRKKHRHLAVSPGESDNHLDTFTDLDLFVPISRARLCLVQVLKWLIKGGLYHLKEDFSKWKCGLLQIGVSFPPKLSKIS